MSSKRREATLSPHVFRDVEKLGHNSFPNESPVYLTHTIFPNSSKTFLGGKCVAYSNIECVDELAQALDLPIGFIARPFIEAHQSKLQSNISMHAKDISRCGDCHAYINPYCDTNSTRWFCSLCGRRNNFDKSHMRYKHIDHKYLPELRDVLNDFRIPMNGSVLPQPALQRPLIHLFLIQEDMVLDTLQAVVDSISAAIDAAHPEIHIGLLTFSHRLGLYSLRGNCLTPTVQLAHLVDKKSDKLLEEILRENPMNPPCLDHVDVMLPIADIVKFSNYIAPVEDSRISLANALNALFESSTNDTMEEIRGKASSLSIALSAIKGWARGKPHVPMYPTEDIGDSESKLGFGPFDFSKIWQLLDASEPDGSKYSTTINASHNSYTGLLIHAFFDSKQEMSRLFDLDEEIKELNELNININLWGIGSFDSNELGLNEWERIARRTGGRIHRFSLGICPKDETILMTETIRRTLTARYATNCDLKIRASPVLQLSDSNPSGLYYRCPKTDAISELSDKLHIPVVSTDASFGFTFKYDETQALSNNSFEFSRYGDSRNTQALCVQFAFSYETLLSSSDVEESADAPSSSSQSQKRRNSKTIDNVVPDEQCLDVTSYLLDSLNILGLDLVSKDYLDTGTNQEGEINNDGRSRLEAVQKYMESKVLQKSIRRVSPYNFNESLRVVKFLRIFTIGIECSSKLNQVLKSCDYVVATALLVKEALMAETSIRQTTIDSIPITPAKRQDNSQLTNRFQGILNHIYSGGKKEEEIVNAITSVMLARMKYYYGSSKNEESPEMEPENLVKAIFENTSVSPCLLLLYTALIRLMMGGIGASFQSQNNEIHDRQCGKIGGIFKDSTIAWINIMQMGNPYLVIRSLYPDLTGFGFEHDIRARSIDLRRDKMVAANSDYFLLDSVFELVCYRALRSHRHTGGVSTNNDRSSNEEDDSKDNDFDRHPKPSKVTNRWKISDTLELLIARLYEHPVIPRLLVAEAGTASSGYFTSYFVEDATNTPIDYNDFKLFVLDIVQSVTKK